VPPPTYVQWFTSLLPGPLAGPWGRRWATAVGEIGGDELLADAKVAVKARFPSEAPEDALPLLGADRVIPGLPGETVAAWRARIAAAWDTWQWAGTRTGLELAATQLGWTTFTLRSSRDWLPDLPPDGNAALWARWWLILPEATHGFALDVWDDPGTWDDGGTWDTDATLEDVARITGHLRAQTNARDRGYVRLLFADGDGDVWGPDEPFDHGVWADDDATFTELEI